MHRELADLKYTLLFYFAEKAEYAIEYRPTNYFERGKEATFSVKTHKCFHPPQKIIYIWKLNGNEMSRKPIFKHRFNGSGRYKCHCMSVNWS